MAQPLDKRVIAALDLAGIRGLPVSDSEANGVTVTTKGPVQHDRASDALGVLKGDCAVDSSVDGQIVVRPR